VHAEDQNREFGTQLFDFLQNIQAASSGKRNVENGNIPIMIADETDRFCTTSRLAKFGEAGSKKALYAFANNFVIVNVRILCNGL